MATAKYLELAVILKAVDQMSGTVRNALGGSTQAYAKLQNSQEKAQSAMQKGLTMGAGAAAGLAMLKKFVHGYGDVDEAQRDLRSSLMKPGGFIDEGLYQKFVTLSERLSKRYAGTQMEYIDMARAMKENRLDPKDILGGVGESVGQLSELFKTAPALSAVFAARMRNDMRVPANELKEMVDLVARLKNVGVGHTGEEAIANMTELYSKAGLGASNLKLYGVKNAMELGALGGMYIAKGQDAPSVGTTFRRIFDNISDADKLKKMNEEAAKFGKHLSFFDEKGNFRGINNFVAQLSTLQGMSSQDVAQILGPAGSAQGMSGDVLRSIAQTGKEDYEDFKRRIADQGTIEQKVLEQQKGQNQQWRIAQSNIDNAVASIGKGYNPVVMKAIKLTQGWSNSITEFTKTHPKITGMTEGIGGVVVAGLALGSAFNFMKAAWFYSGMAKLWAFTGIGRALGVVGTVVKELGYGVAILARTLGTELVASLTAVGGAAAAMGAGLIAGGVAVGYLAFKRAQAVSDDIKRSDAINKLRQDEWEADKIARPEFYKKWEAMQGRTPAAAPPKPTWNGKNIDISDFEHKMKQDMSIKPGPKIATAPIIHYSPTININTNDPRTGKAVEGMMVDHSHDLINLLKSYQQDVNRLKY